MTDTVPFAQALETLHRKRGNKRGSLTKLQRKVGDFLKVPLDDATTKHCDDLRTELDSLVAGNTAIQDEIEVLVHDLSDLLESEETERDRDEETYAHIKGSLHDFRQTLDLWMDTPPLIKRLTKARDEIEVGSPIYRESFGKLNTR